MLKKGCNSLFIKNLLVLNKNDDQVNHLIKELINFGYKSKLFNYKKQIEVFYNELFNVFVCYKSNDIRHYQGFETKLYEIDFNKIKVINFKELLIKHYQFVNEFTTNFYKLLIIGKKSDINRINAFKSKYSYTYLIEVKIFSSTIAKRMFLKKSKSFPEKNYYNYLNLLNCYINQE